ncbi:MAG: hypothetical protein KZQ61_05605, partial [Candidatus Thiodiazotropha sp. (ex Lucinoma aequizonata)]|nr:hypothetical protein [Candidatus Thiodiazotropha sp. (ex Lucinoma aequizonata)]
PICNCGSITLRMGISLGEDLWGLSYLSLSSDYTLIRGCWSYALKTMSYRIGGVYCFFLPLYSSMP